MISKGQKRIGIYAGTFNPVHSGHISFALQALQAAQLTELYFLPERQPRHKPGVEHFGHRVAMVRQAVKPYPEFTVLELPDINLSVERTLPRLQKLFPNDQLVFLFGSDVLTTLPDWPNSKRFLTQTELVVGVRGDDRIGAVKHQIEGWHTLPKDVRIFTSYAPTVSSLDIREALRRRKDAKGLLTSVERYSNRHWLYVSVA